MMRHVECFCLIFFIMLSFLGCNNDKVGIQTDCDATTIISHSIYNSAPNDELEINSLEIEDDCLKINFSASGCDGESWKLKLVDAGVIMESYPPQRNLRLSLKNEEPCDGYFSREISFHINNLKTDGDRVYLNITNSDKSILYIY